MKQIKKTLKQLYLQTPIIYSLLIISMLFISLSYPLKENGVVLNKKIWLHLFYYILTSLLIGITLGNNIIKLKMTHIWSINRLYRKSINISVILFLLIICIIQFPLIYLQGTYKLLLILLSLIIMLNFTFYSHTMKPMIQMFLIYLSFLILSKEKFNFTFSETMLGYIGYYSLLLLVMFLNDKANKNKVIPKPRITRFTTQLNHKYSYLFIKKDQNIGLALAKPTKLMGVYSVPFVVILIGYYWFMGLINQVEIKNLPLVLMVFFNIFILVEMRINVRQVQSFSHVFSGSKHIGIKSKIIQFMDKTIIINNLLFISLMLLLLWITGVNVDLYQIIVTMFIVLIVIYNTYLFIMSSEVFSTKVISLITALIYGAVILIFHELIKNLINEMTTWSYAFFILIIAYLFRWASQRLFEKMPFERLVKFEK